MLSRSVAIAGILISLGLFWLAAANYPGGSFDSTEIIGYSWNQHFISTLFHTTALNGEPNTARSFAVPAMFLLCASLTLIFLHLAKQSASPNLSRLIYIGGPGAMVYAFCAVLIMPIHDLLVTIALIFFLVAVFGIMALLRAAKQQGLFRLGVLCLILIGVCAVMYYGNLLYAWLPLTQKGVFVAYTAWLVAVSFARFSLQPESKLSAAQPIL